MADRFYIGMLDANSSLQNSLKPFAIPDNAFARLDNAFVFRGRVKKRFGSRFMRGTTTPITGMEQIQSRFKINIGTTNGAGAFGATVPGIVYKVGQAFSVGADFFTVVVTGIPATLFTTGPGTGTYNTTTGALVIAGAAINTVVYFYPAQPVMGLLSYQQPAVDIEDAIGFDTQFAYQYSANGWERLGTAVWTGDNSSFFWGYTGRGTSAADYIFYVTNYFFGTTAATSDPMRRWNGATWTDFVPGFTNGTATNKILTARIIVSFKGRLVLLNVVENTLVGAGPADINTVYTNRARWSWVGDPTDTAAFYDNVAGSGGFEDASTKEAIVAAQFIKDRLIVFFESSTWELVYQGNQVDPFRWQRINTELGAESTFSQVPFDKVVLGVGNTGVHACNGSNVERIDDKIPDEVFEIHVDYTATHNDGIARIYGIRDYLAECVYWTFPDWQQSSERPFNNRVLVYNYKTGSWAFNDDSITAFGYYTLAENTAATSLTWAQATQEWQDADFTWRAPSSIATFTNIIAGNQQGYTFIIDNDLSFNSPALQITDVPLPAIGEFLEIYSVNHNVRVDQFVKLTNITDNIIITDANGVVTNLNNGIYKVALVTDVNFFYVDIGVGSTASVVAPTVAYTGGGLVTRVTPIDILTKQYNFYADQGNNASVSEVDFLVDRTTAGECTVDFLVASSDTGIVDDAKENGSLLGTSVLDTKAYTLVPYESQQTRLWHPVYMWADGEYVQLRLYLTDEQAKDDNISESDFELHAMIFYARSSSSKLQ